MWTNDNEPIDELEKIEIELLLEALYRHYGVDFRNYVFPTIRRRIWYRIRAERLKTISGLQEKVLNLPVVGPDILSINVRGTRLLRHGQLIHFPNERPCVVARRADQVVLPGQAARAELVATLGQGSQIEGGGGDHGGLPLLLDPLLAHQKSPSSSSSSSL